MFRIIIHNKATKFINSRSLVEKRLIREKIDLLKENPYIHPDLDIKKMKGVEISFRLRIGNFRIIYKVFKNELLIMIIRIGSRGNIYKKR